VAGARPVATVADGAVVRFHTVSHEGLLPDQGGDPAVFFGALGIAESDVPADARTIAEAAAELRPDGPAATSGPHIVTGPVAVAGARPGDVLAVEVLDLERRVGFGIVSNRHGRGALAGEMPRPGADGSVPAVVSVLATVSADGRGRIADAEGRSVSFPLGPFLGLVGVAADLTEEPSSTPPGTHGGNLDIRHLGVGSTLLLPVQAQDALLYCGDPHYAQGNGEVALTAFEAPLTATLKISTLQGGAARALAAALRHPWGETAEHLIAIGLGSSLDEALAAAVRHALVLVREHSGIAEAEALAFLSAAADFEISQAVNGVRGVHCLIRKADLVAA
jgi:acetamidase/formamidase